MTDETSQFTGTRRGETLFVSGLLLALLVFHGWGASVGWGNFNLPGVEFRQTQTAISAFFIQKDHDFSLAYPTPVLGKPWSIPIEFPLYQWTVVGISNATGLDLTKAGRAVSLACFYLTLPAVFLLLGRWLPDRRSRLLVLCVILGNPLYIFYSRAFLMETMALMASVWFWVGYMRAVETGRWRWFLVANVFGAMAGLVKVTTLVLYLAPAGLWTCRLLIRSFTPAPDRPRLPVILIRAAIATTAPFALTLLWLRFADATKALNPAAEFLLSSNLTGYLLGTGQTRFSAEVWRGHWRIMTEVVSTIPLLIASGVLALAFVRKRWLQVLACLGAFMGIQLLFPELYAWHEYYYIANAGFLLVAFGLVLLETIESRLPRAAAWLVATAFIAAQAYSYLGGLYPIQRGVSRGGSPLTQALRLATEPDDVLVVAGQDWSSNTPYFARRRALMFRNGIERDGKLIGEYFERLDGETVGALVLVGQQRDNRELLDRAVEKFDLDPRPVFTWLDATVYFNTRRRLTAIPVVKTVPDPQEIHLTAESVADSEALLAHEVDLARMAPAMSGKFADMSPRPYKYYATFGIDRQVVDGRNMVFSHPATRLWFHAPEGRRAITIEALLSPAAYAESVPPGDRSDGFGVRVYVEGIDLARRPVLSRDLNPRDVPADRGLQTLGAGFDLAAGESVVVEVGPGPGNNSARDWAMLGKIEIK